jgi:TonB family protein
VIYPTLRLKVLIGTIIVNLLAPLGSAAEQTSNSSSPGQEFLERVRASIVVITGEDKAGLPVPPGIGFWIGGNLIATDNRVVVSAERVHASLPGQESMEVMSRDSYQFATILTVAKSGTPLPIGDSGQVAVNDRVYLAGDADSIRTLSEGIVSKVGVFRINRFSERRLFQITAPMVSAGRGGPVLNSKGEVIGIAAESPDGKGGLGFAIPSSYLTTLLGYRNIEPSPGSAPSPGEKDRLIVSAPVDSKPKLLLSGQPRYTEEARRNQTQGTVSMRILVGEDGEVKDTRVTKGLPDGLIEQAIVAAREMKFKPALRNGVAVPFWLPILVEFNLR